MVQNEQGVFQITRETRENWEKQNPILAAGVMGYETDTNILRIGNGRSRFADLPGFADMDKAVSLSPDGFADAVQISGG